MKAYKTIVATLISSILSMHSYAQHNDTSRVFNPTKNGYKLLFEDNFNQSGLPNENDWLFRKNIKMGGSSNPQNVIKGKALDGSNNNCLLIKFTYDSTQKSELQFKGGGVVSTHNFGYGYYETKVKLYGGKPELAGLHQSFWSMGLTGTNEAEGAGVRDALVNADKIPAENRVLEIDGFEMDSKANSMGQNYHIYWPKHVSKAPKPNHVKIDENSWLTMAYEWLPEQINYYVNGTLISTLKVDSIWKVYAPQNCWFTALPVDVKSWGGLKVPPANTAMQIDYFKFSAKHLPNANRIGNAGFEYKVLGGSAAYPVAWIVSRQNGNDTSAVKVISDSLNANTGKRFLAIQSDKKYHAAVKQIVEFIPDGVYQFSAFIKCSGTQQNASINIISGGKKQVIALKKTDSWTQVTLPKILVRNNQALIEIETAGNVNDWLMLDDVSLAEVN